MPPLRGVNQATERLRQQALRAITQAAVLGAAVGLAAGVAVGIPLSGVYLSPEIAGAAGALLGYAVRAAMRTILDQ